MSQHQQHKSQPLTPQHIADAIMELAIDEDNYTPTYLEVIKKIYNGAPTPPSIEDWMNKSVPTILTILREDYFIAACAVTSVFYMDTADRVSFMEMPPQTLDEARKCVRGLGGKGVKGKGFLVLKHGETDQYGLILTASNDHRSMSGEAAVRHAITEDDVRNADDTMSQNELTNREHRRNISMIPKGRAEILANKGLSDQTHGIEAIPYIKE